MEAHYGKRGRNTIFLPDDGLMIQDDPGRQNGEVRLEDEGQNRLAGGQRQG